MGRASGQMDRLLPEFLVADFTLSPQGNQVVVVTTADDGTPRLWLASVEHRSPPRRISDLPCDMPRFLSEEEIVCRAAEQGTYYAYRMRLDGGQRQRLFAGEIIRLQRVSPDRQWIGLWIPVSGEQDSTAVVAYHIPDGKMVRVCPSCFFSWAADGSYLFVSFGGEPLDQPSEGGKSTR